MEQQGRMREEEVAALVGVNRSMFKRKCSAKVLGTVLEGKRKRSAPGRMGVYVPLTSTIIGTDLGPERTPEPAVGRAAVESPLDIAVPGAHLPPARKRQRARAAAKPITGEREPARLAAATDESMFPFSNSFHDDDAHNSKQVGGSTVVRKLPKQDMLFQLCVGLAVFSCIGLCLSIYDIGNS